MDSTINDQLKQHIDTAVSSQGYVVCISYYGMDRKEIINKCFTNEFDKKDIPQTLMDYAVLLKKEI